MQVFFSSAAGFLLHDLKHFPVIHTVSKAYRLLHGNPQKLQTLSTPLPLIKPSVYRLAVNKTIPVRLLHTQLTPPWDGYSGNARFKPSVFPEEYQVKNQEDETISAFGLNIAPADEMGRNPNAGKQ